MAEGIKKRDAIAAIAAAMVGGISLGMAARDERGKSRVHDGPSVWELSPEVSALLADALDVALATMDNPEEWHGLTAYSPVMETNDWLWMNDRETWSKEA